MDDEKTAVEKGQVAASSWVEDEFSAVLGVPAAAHDDFFALGGTSLAAAKLAIRLAARSGKAVSIADVIQSRTPEAIIARIAQADAVPVAAAPTAPASAGAAVPLSHAQRWYSRVYRGDARNRAVICFSTELPDGTSVLAVRAALIAVADRFDALRLRLTPAGEGLVQHLMPSAAVATLVDGDGQDDHSLLRVVKVAGQRAEVARMAADVQMQEQSRGMALRRGPLFRAVYVRGGEPLGQEPCQLVLTVHHYIFDGTSQKIFMQRIREACRNPASIGAPVASYYQYALSSAHDEEDLAGGDADRWWGDYLSEFAGGCHLPVRHQVGAHPTWAAEETVPTRLYRALALRSREYRVPVSFLRLAALLIVVHALCDTPDAAVCMPIDGRGPTWADTIGMFIDCVVMRHRTRSAETVLSMIDGISSDMAKIMEYREFGFDRIARGVKGSEIEGKYPISGVIINGGVDDTVGPRLDAPESHPIGRKMLFDLQVYFSDSSDRADIELQYRAELLNRAEGARLLATYLHVLSCVAEPGTGQVSELISDAQRRLALPREKR